MSTSIADALIEALADEYKARATYRYVINTFGPIRPFVNIVNAETRHIEALIPLFYRYGVPLPPDDWSLRITKPKSIEEACRTGVAAEIDNVKMYDRLLKATAGYPDVQRVMTRLQRASAQHHLPAFRRCTARASGERRNSGEQRGRRKGGCQGRRQCRNRCS